MAGYKAPRTPPPVAKLAAATLHKAGICTGIVGKVTRISWIVMNVKTKPKTTPAAQINKDSLIINCIIYVFEAPRDFRMPISRVLSVIVVYIARRMIRKLITTATKTITDKNCLKPGAEEDITSCSSEVLVIL
jgi:hypothetical protein